MKRVSRAVLKLMGGVTAAIPLALSGLSTYLILAIVLLTIAAIGAVCWAITDDDRSGRLAMLIDAIRGNSRKQRRKSLYTRQPPEHGTKQQPEP
jgi:hypothetical protein